MATATSFLFILAMLLCDFVATLRARIYIAFLRKDKYSEDDVLKLKDMMKASCRFLQLRCCFNSCFNIYNRCHSCQRRYSSHDQLVY